VVAQKAATVQLLSDGRFTLGLGAGENLNEHVVGGGWPAADVRHEMLIEAVGIIRELFTGRYVSRRGGHIDVESAKLWDLPDQAPPIGIAVSGRQSASIAGELADLVIAVEPKEELLGWFGEAGGAGKPSYGQLPVSFEGPGALRPRPAVTTRVGRSRSARRWWRRPGGGAAGTRGPR
jgi:G6PDH family F420-dependent oxidoreductase